MSANTASQLSSQISQYLDELAQLTDAARFSEAMQQYLSACARFHRYSWHNTLLILWHRPEATQVAGFRKWLEFKRCVRKGEKGIPILAPMFIKTDREDPQVATMLRFRVAYVFDVSQTDGEDLPSAPDWKSPEQHADLAQRLTAFAESRGIQITVEQLRGESQGQSRGGVIALRPEAGTKTLIHELAHELLHQAERLGARDRDGEETEAEAVAYIVARHFGLSDLNSPNYLALWNADSNVIKGHMERISSCARQLILSLEGNTESNTQPQGEPA